MKAYINIGTNIGNKQANIENAIYAIEHAVHCKATRSAVVASMPWGYKSDNRFYNISIAIETDLSPMELLECLQEIEIEMGSTSHRDADGEYVDRIVDIDIMDIEGVKLRTKRLTIPHPHLYERPFFLLPYLELKGF